MAFYSASAAISQNLILQHIVSEKGLAHRTKISANDN